MNQNCYFLEQVRCQIIVNFTVHIRFLGLKLVKPRALGGGSEHWNVKVEKNHRKFFSKAAAKALFCLAPVFKCKCFF